MNRFKELSETEKESSRNVYASEEAIALAWNDFNLQFPTLEDCWNAVFARSASVRCRRCDGQSWTRGEPNMRKMKCVACKAERSYTAGSFFSGVKKVRAWLAAIWFVERGVHISSNRFHSLLKISTSTSWEIFRKVSFVAASICSGGDSLATIPASEFVNVIGRRSLLTPAAHHPIAEIGNESTVAQSELKLEAAENKITTVPPGRREEFSGGSEGATASAAVSSEVSGEITSSSANQSIPVDRFLSIDLLSESTTVGGELRPPQVVEDVPSTDSVVRQVDDSSLNAEAKVVDPHQLNKKLILNVLSCGTLSFDDLAAAAGIPVPDLCASLSSLELENKIRSEFGGRYALADCPSVTEGRQVNTPGAYPPGVLSSIGEIIGRIEFCAQRIARKYLQLYVAGVSWTDAKCLHSNGEGELLDSCRSFPKVTRADLLAYNTPQQVLINTLVGPRGIHSASQNLVEERTTESLTEDCSGKGSSKTIDQFFEKIDKTLGPSNEQQV